MKSLLTLPLIIIIAITISIVSSLLFKHKSQISIMLLGIAIIISGGIIAVDSSSSLGGLEYLIVLFGMSFVIGGFAKKENTN